MKSLTEMSKDLNIPYETLKQAVRDGRITARKSGGTWLIEQDDKLIQFLAKYQGRSTKKDSLKHFEPGL